MEISPVSCIRRGEWSVFFRQSFGVSLTDEELLALKPLFRCDRMILKIDSIDHKRFREFLATHKCVHVQYAISHYNFDEFINGKGKNRMSLTTYLWLCMKEHCVTGKFFETRERFKRRGLVLTVSVRQPQFFPSSKFFIERFHD